MAWNEPGGSGNKDPWGGRKNNEQGPPDLDEVVKKLQEKFGGLFGGGGKRNGSSGSGKAGSIGLGLIAFVAVTVWAISGVYIVEEGTRGVVLQFGKYNKTTQPGPHWHPRGIQSVETVDIANIRGISIGFRAGGGNRQTGSSVGRESLMLTEDENIVDVKLAVQYKVKSASDYLFNVKDPETTLRQVIESAIRETIGKSEMDYILKEGRADVTEQTRAQVQEILDRYKAGLQVTTVNLQDAQPPEQVQEAFADAVKAQGDQARVINEAKAYSNDIVPRARGKAARQLAEANAYKEQVIAEATGEASRFTQVLTEYAKAPEVTRKRLYLEAMESVMTNSSKVLVDVKGGGNLLYLPLDKMMSGGSGGSSDGRRIIEGDSASRQIVEQRLRDNVRGRGVR
ncbi:MAG: FtsH protease activity modulator HflK [Gammaproteobacteria bacterium]|nr:FtsH protease activity modulator HflK [Gammaproteobacteria bacterium]MCF6260347.1 FtsH protease activity modulator HflK [Gammaproteobacteria bacterium]